MVLIGKRIKEFRNKYKYTQTELAEKVGVTKSTIAAYENDSRTPSYDVLIKLANVFRVKVDSLLVDRTTYTLDAGDLTREQIEILETLISTFRRSNRLERQSQLDNQQEKKKQSNDIKNKQDKKQNRTE